MFGAIYIGLSGLNAYSRGLKQVSNNITSLNTTGFKGSTVTFQNLNGASGRGALSVSSGGGSGNGVALGKPILDLQQGDFRTTERDLDLSVDGNGFLVLLDGDKTLYARTGSFEIEPEGFIVLSGTGYRLATLDAANRPVSLSIDSRRTDPPQKTSVVTFADNLSSSATSFTVGDLKVVDQSGAVRNWTAKFSRDGGPSSTAWSIAVTDQAGTAIGTKVLNFVGGRVDPASAKLDFTEAGQTVTFDFSSQVTSFSGGEVSTLRAAKVDGHATGALAGVAIDPQGRLRLDYSNGEKFDLGAVALADFRDPAALEQRDNVFAEVTPGQRTYRGSDDPQVGQVRSRRLEASNVDLSQQFGDMILIQRGFQVSSQLVSVSNDMIQQLFGIRGQG